MQCTVVSQSAVLILSSVYYQDTIIIVACFSTILIVLKLHYPTTVVLLQGYLHGFVHQLPDLILVRKPNFSHACYEKFMPC